VWPLPSDFYFFFFFFFFFFCFFPLVLRGCLVSPEAPDPGQHISGDPEAVSV